MGKADYTIRIMPADDQLDQGPAPPQPATPAEPAIRHDCRAARIGDVTDFAECLVKTGALCPHRFTFNNYHYCAHPQRETIIARTLATDSPGAT
jgi:hypothetical protein